MKNRGRKRLAVLLALIMILGTLPAMTFTSLAEDTGLTGSGTQEDPYRVITGVQLRTAVEKGTAAKPVYIQIAVEEVALEPVGGQADYTFPPTLEIAGKGVVLDLNGNRLRIDPAAVGCAAISLDNGQLTVRDSSGGEGELVTACSRIVDFNFQKTDQSVRKNAFVLEGGTLSNELRNGGGISSYDNTGRIEIKGGTIHTIGSQGTLLTSQSETILSGGTFIGEETNQQSGPGGILLNTDNCRITGGYYDCSVKMEYPNGNITGGYYSREALSDGMKRSAFNNTKYGLAANDDEVYVWKVEEVQKETVTNAPEPGDLYVGGVKVTDDNAADILKDGTASYDKATNTLTLKDFRYSGPGVVFFGASRHDGTIYSVSAGIYYQGRMDDVNKTDLLTIRLVGNENQIDMTMPQAADYPEGEPSYLDTSAAVGVSGADLRIEGDKLTALGADAGTENLVESCGVYVEKFYAKADQFGGKLTLDECALETQGRTALQEKGLYSLGSSEGIYAEDTLRIANADVKASGGTTSNNSCGIYGAGDIEIDGSTVVADGGAGGSMSLGIFSAFDASIKNSEIIADGSVAGGESYGLYAAALTIEGSVVDGSADKAGSYSDGIFASHLTRILDGSRVSGTSGEAGKSAAGIYIDSYLGVSGSTVTGTSLDSAASKNHGIHADYCFEVNKGSSVTGIAGDSEKSKSIGVNVDGDFIIADRSSVEATGGTADAASRGADVEGVLSVQKGSSLEGVAGKAEEGSGVRCGRIVDGYMPVNYWDSSDAYMESIKANEKNTKKDLLTGTIRAKGSEEGNSAGLVLLPYEDDTRIPIPEEELKGLQEEYEWLLAYTDVDAGELSFEAFLDQYYKSPQKEGDGYTYLSPQIKENNELTVSGILLAQGAAGGVQCEPEEGGLKPVTLTASVLRAGEAYDGSDKKEQKSPFKAEAAYRYVETEAVPVSGCPKDETCPVSKFSDCDAKAWYHDGVHYALDNGIMNGTGEATFAPGESTTRAMIVTMLWRMEGEPEASASGFNDLEKDSWYEKAVNWAAAEKIVTGYDEKTFGPNDKITREQLAAILFRYSGAEPGGSAMGLAGFEDADQISGWAKEPLLWAVTAGIINGRTESTLVPQGNATRAEVATMLMRMKNGN